MGIMQRLKNSLRTLMVGRNGIDRLSLSMLWLGVTLLLLAAALSSAVLNILALAIYIVAILRIFSRNVAKRRAENKFCTDQITRISKGFAHRRNRLKNRKQYRYFKCPACKAWLRVPRGAGQVKVTCGKCGHQFSYIAK